MQLPIDIIPNTNPPQFRWNRTVSSPVGAHTIDCEGNLPTGVESSVMALIHIAKQLMKENKELRELNMNFANRIAEQSELLSKKSEVNNRPKK